MSNYPPSGGGADQAGRARMQVSGGGAVNGRRAPSEDRTPTSMSPRAVGEMWVILEQHDV